MSKNNLEEYAYKTIIGLIIKNHYKPGDFLLETELAKSLNLSRTPIRHALGQLVAEGFLDKKKKKGCFIPVPSPSDARNVFYVRKHLDGLAAASAARNATTEDIEFLKRLIKKEKEVDSLQSPQSRMDSAEINEQLHLGIAKISRNKYIEQYCRHAFWRSHTYIFFFDSDYSEVSTETIRKGPQQHLEIVEAIEAMDPEQAQRLMKAHVQTTFEQLFARI